MARGEPSREADAFGKVFARQPTGLRFVVASVWALIVGLLMAGGAAMLGEPASHVWLIGVLGGIGAAVYVLYFAARA